MARLNGFDATQIEPAQPHEAIPPGQYTAVIDSSEEKANSAGTGTFLQLMFRVIVGAFAGRPLWARLNLTNPSAAAVQIARAELSAICRCVGVMAPSDSAELHNVPLVVHVRLKKRVDTGELTNEIVGYSKLDAGLSGPSADVASIPPSHQLPSTVNEATATKHDVDRSEETKGKA